MAFSGTVFAETAPPRAQAGVLDLRGFSLDGDASFLLSGEWDFQWDESAPAWRQNGPRAWIPGLFLEHAGKEDGIASYRLRVLLPSNTAALGLYLPTIHSAFELYADGRLHLAAGRVGRDIAATRHRWQPQTVVVPVSNDRIDLALVVANFGYYKGGIPYPPELGAPETMLARAADRAHYEAFLTGSLVIIAFYHFGLYLLRRRETSPLVFGSFCLVIALRTIASGELWILSLFPGLSWDALYTLYMLTQTVGAPLFLVFLGLLYPEETPRPLAKLLVVAFGAASAFILIAPAALICRSGPLIDLLTVAIPLLCLFILGRALWKRQQGARFMLCGFLILAPAMIHDIIVENRLEQAVLLLPLGLFLFILAQSLLLSARFAEAFTMVEDLSRNLEKKVSERTSELAKERNLLKQKNDLIRQELAMARRIQMQLIPDRSPSPHIAFFYQPMEAVGGDFFDFVPLDNLGTGILVSDVSGHGVPAALVTSMMKSHLLQHAPQVTDPGDLLMALNQQLQNQTGGNFVTALYGILAPDGRSFVFSSAGHNHPYLVRRDGTISLVEATSRSLPLAIQSNQELQRRYASNHVLLEPGSKLLLYTDGLTEAISANGPNVGGGDFESTSLRAVMAGLAEQPATEFIDSLVRALLTFRGSEQFDDDVCMTCIQV